LGLSFKTLNEFGVGRILRKDDFDCNLAIDGWLLGAVDDAEAAFANAFDQLIASNVLTAQVIHLDVPDEKSLP
jgi:hypothetical protein